MRLSSKKQSQNFGQIWCQNSKKFNKNQLRTGYGIASRLKLRNKTYSPKKTISEFVEEKGYDIYFSPAKDSDFIKIELIKKLKNPKTDKVKPKIFVGQYKTIKSFSVEDIFLIDFENAKKSKFIKKILSFGKLFINKKLTIYNFKKSSSST